jgi:hypothetical protein
MVDIKFYQVAFYDLTRDGKCFDESFFKPEEAALALDYVDYMDTKCTDQPTFKTRVFVHYTDGRIYELSSKR